MSNFAFFNTEVKTTARRLFDPSWEILQKVPTEQRRLTVACSTFIISSSPLFLG